MVTMTDLKKSVNKTIKDNFEMAVNSNNVKDSFKTPAFFTTIEPINFNFETKYRNTESYIIRVHYFPKIHNDDIEIYQIADKLRKCFDRNHHAAGSAHVPGRAGHIARRAAVPQQARQ